MKSPRLPLFVLAFILPSTFSALAYAGETAPPQLPQPVYIPTAEEDDTWQTPSGRIISGVQQGSGASWRSPLHMKLRPSEL